MRKDIWGIKIRAAPDNDEIIYSTKIGRFDPNERGAGIYFITNEAIRKAIERNRFAKEQGLGYIAVDIDSNLREIGFDYNPIADHRKIFKGKGIASLIELMVLRDLKKRGIGNYKIMHWVWLRKRRKQLEARFGKKYREIAAEPPTVNEEFTALAKYIAKNKRKKEKPRTRIWKIFPRFLRKLKPK